MTEIRMPPLGPEQWSPEARKMFTMFEGPDAYDKGSKSTVFLTLARHPDLAGAFFKYNGRLLMKGTIPARLREIAILRIAWNTRSAYEWASHVRIAMLPDALSKENIEAFKRGEAAEDQGDGLMTRAEIDAVKVGADAPGWSELERLTLTAVDEFQRDSRVGDATWAGLLAHLSEAELIELLFIFGTYGMLAGIFNSIGIAPEPAQQEFADELPRD